HTVANIKATTDMNENLTTFNSVVKQSCKRLTLVSFAEQPISNTSNYCFFIIIQTKQFSGDKIIQTFKIPHCPHFVILQRLSRNQQTVLATQNSIGPSTTIDH